MEHENLYNQPIVIDNGSGNLKAGFAGQDKPKVYSSSIVGRPKYQRIMASSLQGRLDDNSGSSNGDIFIGNAAQESRGLLKLSYPIEHGIVNDWEDMERIWQNTYTHDLKVNAEDHPLLITEAPLNPRSNRDKMCQILFEQFNIPCVYVSLQASLALYASGRTTGVVVDSGDGVTHVVPVYDGFSLPTSIKRMDIAGRDITEFLSFNIRRTSGVALQSSSELEIVRLMKEKCCFVSKDITADERSFSSAIYNNLWNSKTIDSGNIDMFTTYKLPDGHKVKLGAERFRSPEILFNPQLIGHESPGIHELISLAIAKTDLDLRPMLYQNVILSGGNTLLAGFGERLIGELKALQRHNIHLSGNWMNLRPTNDYDTKLKIKIHAPPERKYSTWIGGSILAGLSTFRKMWVTSQEYMEDPETIHRKCL